MYKLSKKEFMTDTRLGAHLAYAMVFNIVTNDGDSLWGQILDQSTLTGIVVAERKDSFWCTLFLLAARWSE